jgi:hypothetical protein
MSKKLFTTKSQKNPNTKNKRLDFVLTRRKRLRCAFKFSCFRDYIVIFVPYLNIIGQTSMKYAFKGKHILVTGASGGLGAALVKLLADTGAR